MGGNSNKKEVKMHTNRGRANKEGQWGLISNVKVFLVISMLVIFVMVSRYSTNHKTQETSSINELRPRDKSSVAEPDIASILGRTQAYLSTLQRSLSHTSTPTTNIASQNILQSQVPSATKASITSKPPMEPIPMSPTTTTTSPSDTSQSLDSWYVRMTSKLDCLQQRQGAVYLYHVRKAAGTTIRDLLTQATVRWGVPLYETEGITMNPQFAEVQGLLTVLSLRDPIARVMSMYWYEHVGWYDGILHETSRCKTLNTWIHAWRDGTAWKKMFMKKNPSNVYVEVENYYVKMLTGWRGPGPIGEKEYQQAVAVLEKMDVVLVTEWMKDEMQLYALKTMFTPSSSTPTQANGASSSMTLGHQLQGDRSVQQRLGSTLANDEESMKQLLREINGYDLKLWKHAQHLVQTRWKHFQQLSTSSSNHHKNSIKASFFGYGGNIKDMTSSSSLLQCVMVSLSPVLNKDVGLFRPPGHKGPLDIQL